MIPRGFSGYNSRYCDLIKERVFGSLPTKCVACVTILLGSNDANEPESPGGQHVRVDEYSSHLTDIITYLEAVSIPKERIILMSPPNYFHETYLLNRTKPDIPVKTNERVGEYARAAAQVATTQKVTFLDLFTIFSAAPNSPKLFSDGLHLSFAGASLLHEHLSPLVVEKVETYFASQTGMPRRPLEELIHFPLWSDIDPKSPKNHLG